MPCANMNCCVPIVSTLFFLFLFCCVFSFFLITMNAHTLVKVNNEEIFSKSFINDFSDILSAYRVLAF